MLRDTVSIVLSLRPSQWRSKVRVVLLDYIRRGLRRVFWDLEQWRQIPVTFKCTIKTNFPMLKSIKCVNLLEWRVVKL